MSAPQKDYLTPKKQQNDESTQDSDGSPFSAHTPSLSPSNSFETAFSYTNNDSVRVMTAKECSVCISLSIRQSLRIRNYHIQQKKNKQNL